MEYWTEPQPWTSRRRVLHNDINNQERNTKYLKERPSDSFTLMGQIGTELIPLHQQQSMHINYVIKRVPPFGRIYLREASRYFANDQLVMQLDGFESPLSPMQNVEWFQCPEFGVGSFNKYDPDVLKTSYWLNRTRWSSPVTGDQDNPKNIAGWHYYSENSYGHLMMKNPYSTYCLIQFIMLVRNLTSEVITNLSTRDGGYFHFLVTELTGE
jgi:hypothetical protein